jgi:hypothetical protein
VSLKEFASTNHWLHYVAAACGATLVIVLGRMIQKRQSNHPVLSQTPD